MQTVKLSVAAMLIIRTVLQTNGEKMVDTHGKEVDAPRTLNGIESSKRHHFFKSTRAAIETKDMRVKEFATQFENFQKDITAELKTSNAKNEGEKDKDYENRIKGMMVRDARVMEKLKEINSEVEKLYQVESDVENTDDTWEMAKKYFVDYGNKVGFGPGDDTAVEEVISKLNIQE